MMQAIATECGAHPGRVRKARLAKAERDCPAGANEFAVMMQDRQPLASQARLRRINHRIQTSSIRSRATAPRAAGVDCAVTNLGRPLAETFCYRLRLDRCCQRYEDASN